MAITNTRITNTEPTTVFQAVGQQAITVMYICNTSNTDVSVNMYVIDSGDSSGASEDNMVYAGLLLTASNTSPTNGDTYVISQEKLILNNNDLIEIEANIANCITVTVSSISV
jgi:hypothetical protein